MSPFGDEFKRDAATQITERGFRLAEVSQRLAVSCYSLYSWKRQLSRSAQSGFASFPVERGQLPKIYCFARKGMYCSQRFTQLPNRPWIACLCREKPC